MSPNPDTIDASLTLDDVVTTMLAQNRRWAPVVDDAAYFGLLAVSDIVNFPSSEWTNITARDIARTDLLPAAPQDPVSTRRHAPARIRKRRHRRHEPTDE